MFGYNPRVNGYLPGSSSLRPLMSPFLYARLTGMLESVTDLLFAGVVLGDADVVFCAIVFLPICSFLNLLEEASGNFLSSHVRVHLFLGKLIYKNRILFVLF